MNLIRRVVRAASFKASILGVAQLCRLRLLLENESEYEPVLPERPEAILGRVIHAALEASSTANGRDVVPQIWQLLDQPRNYATSAAINEQSVPIPQLLPMASLLKRIGLARSAFKRNASSGSSPRGKSVQSLAITEQQRKVAIERSYATKDGELIGRVDRWERRPGGSVLLLDYKTGKIKTPEGDIRSAYIVQMFAYALLLLENGVGDRISVSLIGSDGGWVQDFDARSKNYIVELIRELARVMPRDSVIPSEDLATCGKGCTNCRFRPKCPVYLEESPKHWTDDVAESWWPTDTWGQVTQVSTIDSDLYRFHLRGPTNRLVCVSNVPRWMFDTEPQIGVMAYFFDLRVSSTGALSQWPANYHVVDRTRRERSAHTAVAILEQC